VPRRATAADAQAIADVLRAARAAQPWFPPLHTPDETLWFVQERLLPEHETWVVEDDRRVVAFAAIKDDVLGHLFVHPDAQQRGIGTALLEHTQLLRPDGFSLWTHQASEACAFYEARGLVAVERTDGSTNMEKLPDVRYEWRPRRPAPAGPGSPARSRAAGSRSSPRRSR
jgi:GNAT superfamily N-acetyltransferase